MKKIVFILLALMALLQVNAQKEETETVFAPIGAKWYYKIQLSNTGPDWYYRTFEAIKDTIIEEKKCVVLEQIEHYKERLAYIAGYEYLYVEGKKVYNWDKWDKKFSLLYDFSANVGDSWNVPCKGCGGQDSDLFVTITVNAIDYVDVSGRKLKRFATSSNGLYSFGTNYNYITEQIGGEGYLFLFAYAYDDIDIPRFYCYSDNETTEPCDMTVGISYLKEQTVLTITNGYVQLPTSLQLKTNKAQFYGMDGKIVLSGKIDNNQRISVSKLSAGIFILSIETKNEGVKTFKINKP